jgi:hypothetical protein
MSEVKEYKHPNGYSAKLYGKSSMSVFYEGREVLHTGFRNANTEAEVMEVLDTMGQLLEETIKIFRK